MLRKVVGEAPELEDAAAAGTGGGRARTQSNVSVDSQALTGAAGAGGGGSRFHTPTRTHNSGSSNNYGLATTNIALNTDRAVYTIPTMTDITTNIIRPEFPVSLEGKDIQLLLQKRPELIEFLSLEITAMKIETEKLVKNE